MYYTQQRSESVYLPTSAHIGTGFNGDLSFHDRQGSIGGSEVTASVYSYRSKRPHDAVSSPVYGEALINQGSGLSGYIASYKQAVLSLNDEASSQATPSGSSGRGAYDSGHLFYSRKTPLYKGHYSWSIPQSHTGYRNPAWNYNWCDTGVGAYYITGESWLSLENPATHAMVDKSTTNAVQRLASATVPDRISGSLGQDLVDLAQLPKFIASLVRMSHELPLLSEKWSRLSSRVRDAIDYSFRHPNKVPKAVARRAGSGYLEWLFVLQPYVEDIHTIVDFLSKGSARLLTRETFTKNAPVSETGFDTTSGSYITDGYAQIRVVGSTTRSVHVAVGWMAKGVTVSDEKFLSKARSLNRSLGLWYPSLLWDIMPWSWLLDWCLHLGDTIDNVAAIQQSGYNPIYSWATVRESVDARFTLLPFFKGSRLLDAPSGQLQASALARYPFEVDGLVLPSFSGLSSAQKTILAALGLSHLK